MALDFPSSPTNNQVYENYIYSATSGAWQKLPGNTFATTAISDTPPVSPANGDLWWNSADGKFYIYYSDGSSAQWVSAALPAVAVSDTPPAGYDGQMWLDSTDGSMYVYYTDPGGASSSWIGAVSRSGGILQVVSATTATTTTTNSTSYSDTSLSASITPRSTSSKILISVTVAELTNNNNAESSFLTIFRGDTATGTALGTDDMALTYTSTSMFNSAPAAMTFLDSPATTSTQTYTVGIKTGSASNTALARSQQTMILMEVAG